MCEVYLVFEAGACEDGFNIKFGDAFFSRSLAEQYVRDQLQKVEWFKKTKDNKPPFERIWDDPEMWRPALWDPKIKEIQVYSE